MPNDRLYFTFFDPNDHFRPAQRLRPQQAAYSVLATHKQAISSHIFNDLCLDGANNHCNSPGERRLAGIRQRSVYNNRAEIHLTKRRTVYDYQLSGRKPSK